MSQTKLAYFILAMVTLMSCQARAEEMTVQCKERCAFEELVYVLEYNIQTDCSVKSKNILKKKVAAYQEELNRCTFEPLPTPTATPQPDDFVTIIEAWESKIIERVNYHYTNPYNEEDSAWMREHKYIGYYDGAHAFKKLEVYFTNRGKHDTASKAQVISTRLEAEYADLLPRFRTRSQWHFAESAAMVSDDLLKYSANNPTWGCGSCIDEALAPNQLDIRGLAYQLRVLALADRKQLVVAPFHDLQALAIRLSAHTEGYPHNFNLFYMEALLGHVLIDYQEELEPTIMPLEAAKRIANFIRPYIQADGAIVYGQGNHGEAQEVYPELNLIVAPLFHKLGEKQNAELLFAYGVEHADLNFYAKAVPQNILFAVDMAKDYL